MKEPAARISTRFQAAWLVKARGSSLSWSSPAMAQKPPKGTALRE